MSSQPLCIPTVSQAEALLAEAETRNPGPWAEHSRWVAEAAARIAAAIGCDPERARVLGLLHDVGRRAGVTHMRHALDGYTYLMDLGWGGAARACLTHSFPNRNPHEGAGKWDASPAELAFVTLRLAEIELDDYDRLVQLGDSLCLPSGPVLMEKRLVDVAMRYGFNAHTQAKWQAFFAIQRDFEARAGKSIYALLPEAVENSFGGK